MLKLRKITALVVMLVMMFTPVLMDTTAASASNCSTVCDPCGAASAGWQSGYAAGQAMVQAASQVVNGVLCAIGTIVSATAGLVAGAVCSLVNWVKKGIRKAKKMAKKAWNWVKKVANKAKNKVKKAWAKIKNFWNHLVNCWHNCHPCNQPEQPTAARVKQVKKSKIDSDIATLVVRHQEARFKYITDKKYQKTFNSCGKLQQKILNKVNRSIEKRDYFEYDVLMNTLKKMTNKRNKAEGDNIMAYGPILDGLRSNIKTKMMNADKQERKDLSEMLKDVDYYNGFYKSYADGFYVKKAVKIPTLK